MKGMLIMDLLKSGRFIRLSVCAALFLLFALFTGCSDVNINGQSYPGNTQNVTVSDSNIKNFSSFNKLKNLKTLDITALDLSVADYEKIASEVNDNVRIIWSVPVGDMTFPSNSTSIEISPETNINNFSFFDYFDNLKALYINSIETSPLLRDIINAAKSKYPDITIVCKTSVYGVEFDSSTEFLDLNKIKIKDLSDLELALSIFPNIKTVEMCSCQLENEVIAEFRDRHPDKKIVWAIRFWNYVLRTDAQAFSTLAGDKKRHINTELAEPIFKYCTELRGLDLGHNSITDISGITNLKKLHTLILADNWISDISPLAELKELTFLEIQHNKIQDVSPLTELPLLEDVYMVYNPVKNMSTLAKCPKMRKLYISHCGATKQNIWDLVGGLPKGCRIVYGDSWNWRCDYNNWYIREAFRKWKTVKEFPNWRDTVYWDKDVYNYWQS